MPCVASQESECFRGPAEKPSVHSALVLPPLQLTIQKYRADHSKGQATWGFISIGSISLPFTSQGSTHKAETSFPLPCLAQHCGSCPPASTSLAKGQKGAHSKNTHITQQLSLSYPQLIPLGMNPSSPHPSTVLLPDSDLILTRGNQASCSRLPLVLNMQSTWPQAATGREKPHHLHVLNEF